MTTAELSYRCLIPEEEIDRRLSGLQDRLSRNDTDGALVVQKSDLFYYTGTTQQGWLWVPASGTPLFMVFKDVERARAESCVGQIIPLISPRKIPGVLRDHGVSQPASLGLELDVMPANTFFLFQEIFKGTDIRDVSPLIRYQRAVKSSFEIDCIRAAGKMADRVTAKVPELVRAGMTTVALAGQVESYARSLGHQGTITMRLWDNHLFYGHILCGPDAAVPGALSSPTSGTGLNPYVGQGASMAKVMPDQPLLVDYVFALDGYLADQARIYCLGDLPDTLCRAHEAMLAVQKSVASMARPGAVTGDIYASVIEQVETLGFGEHFMGAAEPKIRFVGHGLGIELDEFPFIAKGQTLALEAGMVLALEPKVILPGLGVVGIENTFVVTEDGLEALTCFPDGIVRL